MKKKTKATVGAANNMTYIKPLGKGAPKKGKKK